MQYSHRKLLLILSCAAAALLSAPSQAQQSSESGNPDIVVVAERLRGSVETKIPPVQVLNADDITAYGASSASELLAAISPQTGSGRGRGGGGPPVILLNGQRISGFRELRDLPPDAIRQVQVFPEEVALQYGFRPDQRVINFILRDNFASFNTELEAGTPQDGGFTKQGVEANFTSIGKSTRLNINTEYDRSSSLTQAERDIVNDADANRFSFDGNINDFRTLRPATDSFETNITLSKALAPQTNLSLNANYKVEDSTGLRGLPTAALTLPGTSPFSPGGGDLLINRAFTSPRPLERNSTTHTANFGAGFNSQIGTWRWALTADYASVNSSARTNRNADFSALQAGLNNGSINPFAGDFGSSLSFLPADTSDSLRRALTTQNTFSGPLFRAPAGPVLFTLRTGFNLRKLDSQSLVSSRFSNADLKRSEVTGAVNIDIPILERGVGALGFVGDVSINGNYGLSEISDFGRLTEYTAGVRWSPIESLSFQASLIGDEGAPSIAQLGNPLQITPNVTFFDFGRGQTVLIDVVSGGNPNLLAENRRDLKLALNWDPKNIFGLKTDGLNFQIEYFRNKSTNTTSDFPLLTPEIEAAFPARVVRAIDGRVADLTPGTFAEGQILSVDQRPVNFAEERAQSIRWGFNFSGGIGPQRGGFGGGGSGAGRGGPPGAVSTNRGGPGSPAASPASGTPTQPNPSTPPAAAAGRGPGGAGFGGGGRGGMPGGGPPSRWQISLYHSYQIQDEILIAPSVPILDRLNGSATSGTGGTPQHRIELSSGVFYKGMGIRVEGNYRSATRVNGSDQTNSGDLRFGALTSLNLRLFTNLDDRGKLTQKLKFLKGTRLVLRIDNLLNDIIDVRDENGVVPLSYQPGFVDPVGRYFEFAVVKRF
jgi:iron complex outermembrane recepter protein